MTHSEIKAPHLSSLLNFQNIVFLVASISIPLHSCVLSTCMYVCMYVPVLIPGGYTGFFFLFYNVACMYMYMCGERAC